MRTGGAELERVGPRILRLLPPDAPKVRGATPVARVTRLAVPASLPPRLPRPCPYPGDSVGPASMSRKGMTGASIHFLVRGQEQASRAGVEDVAAQGDPILGRLRV